ncbi:MAG: hypothetical protein IPI14_06990 [Polaromonas sp.]|nr:hypothetical protein [Polaromonas sp.]
MRPSHLNEGADTRGAAVRETGVFVGVGATDASPAFAEYCPSLADFPDLEVVPVSSNFFIRSSLSFLIFGSVLRIGVGQGGCQAGRRYGSAKPSR